MFRLYLLIVFIAISISASCQNNLLSVVKQKELLTEYYDLSFAGCKVLYLPMEYGKSEFTNQQEAALENLKNVTIARVDLVYSDFPAHADFSALTKKRFESLQKLLPGIFSDPNTEFRKVRQTIGKTKETAAGLEHGFFIYFRPKPDVTSSKKEIKKLKSLLGHVDTIPKRDSITPGFWCWQIIITVDTVRSPFPKIPEGANRKITRISLKQALDKGYLLKEQEAVYRPWGDSVWQAEDRRDEDCESLDGSYFYYDLVDTTVTEVFKRHRWNGAFVLADVTGSMYPYSGQLLKWLQLNLTDKKKRHFIFFNDGDFKADADKIIGKTGGIYSVYTNQYDEVEKTIMTAMTNGGGGDAPENNIEAILQAEKECAECDSIVMVADNWAPVKDISLITSLKKPVKVVLCGVFGKINKDYLKLARDTKGSIHLMEEDIYSLSELKEGETIKIHGVTYKLIRGEFVEFTPKSL